jgi:uncharacterized membrane protein
MENQQLPNATLVLVMGILSIVGCCCYGLPGLIFGVVAIILGSKATKLYKQDPQLYTGYGNVQAGKIMGIIGVVLSVLAVIFLLWTIAVVGWDAIGNQELLQERMQEMMKQ